MNKLEYSKKQLKFAEQFKNLGFELIMTGGNCNALFKSIKNVDIYVTVYEDPIAPESWKNAFVSFYETEEAPEPFLGPMKIKKLKDIKELIAV